MGKMIAFTLTIYLAIFGLSSAAVDFGDVDINSSLTVFSRAGNSNDLQWIAICIEGFNNPAADVTCRQLGYIKGVYSLANRDFLTTYVYTAVQCPTVSDYKKYGETHLMRCNLTGPVLATTVSCNPVLLQCTGGSLYDFPYEGQVYLDKTGTISPSDGQVEMYLEGQWQKICYTDKFNDAVATTVCRQYGYTGFTDKEPVNVIGRPSLDFESYSCSGESFPCFSHCIPAKPYPSSSTCRHVFLNCEFDTASIKFRSSGSEGICAINENQTVYIYVTEPSNNTGFGKGIGAGIGITLGVGVIVLIIVGLALLCWMIRRRRNYENMR